MHFKSPKPFPFILGFELCVQWMIWFFYVLEAVPVHPSPPFPLPTSSSPYAMCMSQCFKEDNCFVLLLTYQEILQVRKTQTRITEVRGWERPIRSHLVHPLPVHSCSLQCFVLQVCVLQRSHSWNSWTQLLYWIRSSADKNWHHPIKGNGTILIYTSWGSDP